jgi:hypothetical protein
VAGDPAVENDERSGKEVCIGASKTPGMVDVVCDHCSVVSNGTRSETLLQHGRNVLIGFICKLQRRFFLPST